jgi:hypothetical protein
LEDPVRAAFFDTIQDLIHAQGRNEYDQVIWKAEYLNRHDRWYHFYGFIRSGKVCSIGHEYDLRAGSARSIEAETSVFTLLDFSANATIAAYVGYRSVSTEILGEITECALERPEVVRVGIEARSRLSGGRRLMAVTDIAFVGLRDTTACSCRSLTTSFVSPYRKWCRDRRYITAASATP